MNSSLLALPWTQLWQVTLLLVVVAILVRVFARNRPHLAYVLWLVVLVKCVMPPLFTSASGVFCWLQPVEQAAERTVAPPVDTTLIAGPSMQLQNDWRESCDWDKDVAVGVRGGVGW